MFLVSTVFLCDQAMMKPLLDSRNVSARGCEVEFLDTNIGTLDICEYYRQIIPARISNFQCSSCSAELCNHAGYVEEEQEEEEEEEEDAPVEEEEDAAVEDDEEIGDNSSNVFTVSLGLLVAVVVAGRAVM